jgi:hypothetical protein
MAEVLLPAWAEDLGAGGRLLVPEAAISGGAGEPWRRTDWLGAAFWYLHGLAERAFERANGPIHSYSFRLGRWDERIWERAWVNRIALFLRRWAARETGQTEEAALGPLPSPELWLTHDVDAVTKTMAVRMKQAVFMTFKALRRLPRWAEAARGLVSTVGYLLGSGDYWNFDSIREIEEAGGTRSTFFFYGGRGGFRRNPRDLLFDPSYEAGQESISAQMRGLAARGWTCGLHQSFASWRNAGSMLREKKRVEEALGGPVTVCRQHWLRFSWEHTWAAQGAAGLKMDCTLGFNDRPGFRNGSALRHRPLGAGLEGPLPIEAVPTVLMDSHLYDYQGLGPEEAEEQIARWVQEIAETRGQGAVIWHQHVFGPDYGWRRGYETLLRLVRETGISTGILLSRDNG